MPMLGGAMGVTYFIPSIRPSLLLCCLVAAVLCFQRIFSQILYHYKKTIYRPDSCNEPANSGPNLCKKADHVSLGSIQSMRNLVSVMFHVLPFVTVVGLCQVVTGSYVNNFDQRVEFKCTKDTQALKENSMDPDQTAWMPLCWFSHGAAHFLSFFISETISRVHSVHDNGAEDRRFEFECREIGMDTEGTSASCAWSANYENQLDKPLDFECGHNGFINGMISEHDNGAEDRRWKFRCCRITDIHMIDCDLTPWTNDFDKPQDYRLPSGMAMKSVFSEHDNGAEDRRYRYEICNILRSSIGPVVG